MFHYLSNYIIIISYCINGLQTEISFFLFHSKLSQVDFKEQKFEDFYDLIPMRLSQPPWNYNLSLEMGWRVSLSQDEYSCKCRENSGNVFNQFTECSDSQFL